MEGGSVEHVRRLLVGQQIYVAPSLDFIPYPYPSFHYYVSAAAAQLFGLKLASLRLVSLIASLISFLTIFLFVRQETCNAYAASLATGLLAATFRIGGAWFDIARVDSLFLMLVLVGLYIVRFQRAYALLVCAGLLFSVAILTKQTALIVTAPVICWLAITDRKKALVVVAVIGVVAGGGTLVLQPMSGGWYKYYVFDLQFGALLYSPRKQIPTNDDVNAGHALVAMLENIQGRLFMPYHSGCYVRQLRERCGSAQQMAIQDIIQFGGQEPRTILEADYRRAMAERRYAAIVMEGGGSFFQSEFERHYEKRRLDLGGPDAL